MPIIATFFVALLVYLLSRRYSIIIPFREERCIKSAIYGTKSLSHYAKDKENIANIIGKSVRHSDFRHCVDAIYYFKMRYGNFKRYGISVDKDVEAMIKLVDSRYSSVRHRKLFIF